MGVVNQEWRDAMAFGVAWQCFTANERKNGWPETMAPRQLAVLQRPYSRTDAQIKDKKRYCEALIDGIRDACKSGALLHTATTVTVAPKPPPLPQDSSFASRAWLLRDLHRNLGNDINVTVGPTPQAPKSHDVTTFQITAHDFAAWLAALPATPSDHITAWFEAVGAGAAQVATATNTTPSDAPAKKTRSRKPAWHTVAMPYMKTVFKNGAYSSATVFYRALLTRAGGEDSPFTKSGGALYCPEAGTTVAEGTLGTKWAEIRDR